MFFPSSIFVLHLSRGDLKSKTQIALQKSSVLDATLVPDFRIRSKF